MKTLLTFIAGGIMGMFTMALLIAAGRARDE